MSHAAIVLLQGPNDRAPSQFQAVDIHMKGSLDDLCGTIAEIVRQHGVIDREMEC